jgi:predicted O-methyltransferase YrrM
MPLTGYQEMARRLPLTLAFHLDRVARRLERLALRRELSRAGATSAPAVWTHMTERELRRLFSLASEAGAGATALEVGAYLGASTCFLAAALKPLGGHVVSVDTWQNETMDEGQRDTFAEFEANTRGVRDAIVPVRKRSDQLAERDLPTTLDLVFLDGDHSYEAVHGDFALLAPRIRSRGVIALHDVVHFAGVARTVGEALSTGEWKIQGLVDNLVWLEKQSHSH